MREKENTVVEEDTTAMYLHIQVLVFLSTDLFIMEAKILLRYAEVVARVSTHCIYMYKYMHVYMFVLYHSVHSPCRSCINLFIKADFISVR